MIARWVRTWDGKLLRPLLLLLARWGVTPNGLTLGSLIIIILSGFILAQGYLVIGAGVLLLGGFLDGLDGELARVMNQETRLGAFLDSIYDHYGDFAIYLGLLWLYLSSDSRLEIILVFMALFGSMLGSQIRSRAGMLGIDTKDIGLATRFERNWILIGGIFIGQLPIALGILAGLNNFSAIQRLIFTVQVAHKK